VIAAAAPPPDARDRPSFLDDLCAGAARLLRLSTAQKIEALAAAGELLRSEGGAPIVAELERMLIDRGYPKRSANLEPQLLATFLSPQHLDAIVDNPAALPGGRALLDGGQVEIAPGVQLTGFPAGPLLVIGSGNSMMPALVATVHALLASCPVVVRGSRLNHPVLEHVFSSLRSIGHPVLATMLDQVHSLSIDHRDPEDARRLHWLLRHGPFAAVNLWGGRAALDALVAALGANPHHPVPILMKPLTGVAVVSQRHLAEQSDLDESARALAEAILAMGQQLCSSPTEAYFVGKRSNAIAFAERVARALELDATADGRTIDDRSALLLDRIRNRAEEVGSAVFVPATEDSTWTLVVSSNRSVFTRLPPDCALSIHDRSGFLELIVVPDLETVGERIAALPSAPCHGEIDQVQTIIRIARLDEMAHLIQDLRSHGGVYRVVPPEHVVVRHPLEPLDGQHLIALLTRQTVLI
jgi:hypothetical protein